ncbi:MAG: diguanylate cyclase [Ilumatobacter sp.]
MSDDARQRVDDSINRLSEAVERTVREGTMLIGFDGRVVDSIDADVRLGVSAERLVGDHPLPSGWKMFDDDGEQVPLSAHPALVALETGQFCERVLTYEPSDVGANPMRLRLAASPVVGDSQVGVNLMVADNDRRRHTRRMLEAQELRFRTMTDMLPVAVWESTATGEVTYVNPKFTELTGFDVDTVPDLPMLDIVHPDDVSKVMGAAAETSDSGGYQVEYRLMHTDGSTRWVTSTTRMLTDDERNVSGMVGAIEDIDEVRRLRAADGAGVGATQASLSPEVDPSPERSSVVAQAADVPESSPGPVDAHSANEEPAVAISPAMQIDAPIQISADLSDEPSVPALRGSSHDTLDEPDPLRDATTGLANRKRLNAAIAATPRGTHIGLLMVDIDHMKKINDVHGHGAGDEVLRHVGRCVSDVVGPNDLVTRVAGDELVVWAAGLFRVALVADTIVAAVAAAPLELSDGSGSVDVTVTVGASSGPSDRSSALMKYASTALKDGKNLGRSQSCIAPHLAGSLISAATMQAAARVHQSLPLPH